MSALLPHPPPWTTASSPTHSLTHQVAGQCSNYIPFGVGGAIHHRERVLNEMVINLQRQQRSGAVLPSAEIVWKELIATIQSDTIGGQQLTVWTLPLTTRVQGQGGKRRLGDSVWLWLEDHNYCGRFLNFALSGQGRILICYANVSWKCKWNILLGVISSGSVGSP